MFGLLHTALGFRYFVERVASRRGQARRGPRRYTHGQSHRSRLRITLKAAKIVLEAEKPQKEAKRRDCSDCVGLARFGSHVSIHKLDLRNSLLLQATA